MDTDEILYTVSEAVRMSRELQDVSREKQKTSDLSSTLPLKKGSLSSFGSGACLLDPALLQEVLASPYEAMCAFLTITLHLKRAHGLPGPSSLDEMSQAVCKKIQAANGMCTKENKKSKSHNSSLLSSSLSSTRHQNLMHSFDCMLETVALQIVHWEKKRERETLLALKRKVRSNLIFQLQEEITKTKLDTQDTLASNAICAKVYDLMVNFVIQAGGLHNFSRRGIEERDGEASASTGDGMEDGGEKEDFEVEEHYGELEQKVRDEVRSALESVFPLYSVRSFCLDIYDNKVKQLGELTRLVVGILCFNAFTGKSSVFKDFAQCLCPSRNTLIASQRAAWDVVVLLKHFAVVSFNAKAKWKKKKRMRRNGSDGATGNGSGAVNDAKVTDEDEVQKLADLISLAEQSTAICMEVGLSWNALGVDSAQNGDRMSMHLAQLKSIVEGKQAVSKDAVYPLFDNLGRLYIEGLDFEFRQEAMNESRLMKQLTPEDAGVTDGDLAVFMQPPFVRRLKQAESSCGLHDADLVDLDEEEDVDPMKQERDEVVKQVFQRWPEPLTKSTGSSNGNGDASVSERDYDVFEYGAYCPVSIVEDKVLRRGLPESGVVVLAPSFSSAMSKTPETSPEKQKDGGTAEAGTAPGDQKEKGKKKDRWFSFASKKYRNKFLKTPGRYTAQVTLECVTRLPQLIGLLKLTPQRATVDYVCQLVDSSERTKEYGSQTPTHYVESLMDPNYEWNEWALRRKALQMANLRQKQTHSGQTDKSHFRREVETQVYLPKDNDTQTKMGAGTGMPRKIRHITGLRGASSKTKMHFVELELDLEQERNNK